MIATAIPTPDSWSAIIANACKMFDNLEDKGYGDPGFSLGGGTILKARRAD